MIIVDAQVHIWGAETAARPWRAGPRNAPHRPVPYTKDDLLRDMDAAGVARAILVPPSMEGDHNDLVLEAARLHPDRFAAMGRLDLSAGTSRGLMANWREQPGMLGLRLVFSTPYFAPLLDAGVLEWFWAEAEEQQIPLMVHADFGQVHLIDGIAERYPRLKFIMDHLCLNGPLKDDAAFSSLDLLLVLAKRPNVAVKASALQCYTSAEYPYRGIHPYLHRAFEAFGPRRFFWGTDLTRLPCTYRQAITTFTEELPWLSGSDLEWVMGRGVCEWTRWALP